MGKPVSGHEGQSRLLELISSSTAWSVKTSNFPKLCFFERGKKGSGESKENILKEQDKVYPQRLNYMSVKRRMANRIVLFQTKDHDIVGKAEK